MDEVEAVASTWPSTKEYMAMTDAEAGQFHARADKDVRQLMKHQHGGQDCDPSEEAAGETWGPLEMVLQHRASPPEYPGLALVPVADLDRLQLARDHGLYRPRTEAEVGLPTLIRNLLRFGRHLSSCTTIAMPGHRICDCGWTFYKTRAEAAGLSDD